MPQRPWMAERGVVGALDHNLGSHPESGVEGSIEKTPELHRQSGIEGTEKSCQKPNSTPPRFTTPSLLVRPTTYSLPIFLHCS